MTPLAKGDKIVGVPDGAGGWLAVDLVVIENRPRGHGFGLAPWLPNAVTVRVQRMMTDTVVLDDTFATAASPKGYAGASESPVEHEECSGQLSYPDRFYRRRRAQLGDLDETSSKFLYVAEIPAGGPAWFLAELTRSDDVRNSR